MDALMALVVGWALVGAFVFTLVITCLSLVKVVRFANPSQQKALFVALILEIVLVFGGRLVGVTRIKPDPVRENLRAEGSRAVIEQLLTPASGQPNVTKTQLLSLVDGIEVRRSPELRSWKQDLEAVVRQLPSETISREAAQPISARLRGVKPR